jgi:tetratricopeptide (TPR) repeat protein
LRDAQKLFGTGKYAECARLAAAEIDEITWNAEWHILKAKAELALGKYEAALRTVEAALDQYPSSLELRLLARTVYRINNRPAAGDRALDDAARSITESAQHFRSPADRVAMGRFLLERGVDPRQILELIYDPLRKAAPEIADVYFATAELALDKYDNALAAETLTAAPKSVVADPQYHYLLARAYESDEPERASAALKAALDINPNHVESLLLRIDKLVDAEEYAAADAQLDRVFDINSNHPTAWAYKAVLAHFASDAKSEEAARKQALSTWTTNPEVDHLSGKKLAGY